MVTFKDKRIFFKSVIWEGIAFVLAVVFYWIYFGTFTGSLIAAVLITLLKSIGLYFYLKAWKKTQWLKK